MRRVLVGAFLGLFTACSAAGIVEGGSTSTLASGGVGVATTVGLGSIATATAAATGTSGHGSSSNGGNTGSAGSSGTGTSGAVNTCGGETCPEGWGCIDSQCCELPCNGVCCPQPSEQVCGTVAGVAQCLQSCTTNGRCPSSAPCCAPVNDGGSNACINQPLYSGQCICNDQADCPTGDSDTACCAPATNASGNPVGPYVCKPNDGDAYDCCYGATNFCSGSTCCIKDEIGNEFCALPCTGASDCSQSTCQNYDFSITTTTCSGPTACGP